MQVVCMFQLVLASLLLSHSHVAQAFSTRNTISLSRFSLKSKSVSLPANKLEILRRSRSELYCESTPENVNPVDDSDTGMEDEDNYMGQEFDQYPPSDPFEDAEMIEAMREERIIANDRWQSCLIRDQQAGEWEGTYEMFIPKKGINGFALSMADSGAVKTSLTAGIFNLVGVPIFFSESYSSSAPPSESTAHSLLLRETRAKYEASDFRPSEGNQIVANVYTVCKVDKGEVVLVDSVEATELTPMIESTSYEIPESYVAEIAIKEGNIRTRVRFAYTNKVSAAMDEAEKIVGNYDMFFTGLAVIRETQNTLSGDKDMFLETLGSGIYDPQVSGEPYVQLNFPGKLSLLFPRGISGVLNKSGHALTIEWEGKAMRYQVDRRFNELTDGRVRSLELTEVRAADAAEYPAGFAIKPDYMQYNT